MSKVEIVGPRQLLGETLSLVRKEGDLHIEPSAVGFIDDIHKKDIHSLLPDEKALFEKIFLEELEGKLKALFSFLSVDGMRESFLTPRPIMILSAGHWISILRCASFSVRSGRKYVMISLN